MLFRSLVLIVAVLATSYAGPIVRFAAAPALAIAFWRLALVLPVTGGLAVLEGSREQGAGSSVTRQHLLPAPRSLLPLMTLSGLLLALHFWSWIASLRFTTVASSVVLVSLKPVFAWGIAAAWLQLVGPQLLRTLIDAARAGRDTRVVLQLRGT